jgi:6-pyruvoyltetrahydropterin/6-carboxytetrahydropterin synthase
MPLASLTRRVAFAAAHRYRRPEWDDARNAATFGLCARPSFHGHSYACHVTVRGPIDEATGFCVDLGLLDRVLAEEVRERFDHRNLNLDVPEFADGAQIPPARTSRDSSPRACRAASPTRWARARRAWSASWSRRTRR